MIKREGYFKLAESLDPGSLPPHLREGYDYVREVTEEHTKWDYYHADPDIMAVVDKYLADIGDYLEKQGAGDPATAAEGRDKKAPPKSKKKPEPQEKARSKPPKETKASAEYVRDIDIELRLISRFINLHSKQKTYKQVLDVLNALQRAVQKGHVRKSKNPTPYHKEIAWVQENLVKALKRAFNGIHLDEKKELRFDPAVIKKLRRIRDGFKVHPSVPFALRYFGMEGKRPDREKAKKLADSIEKAIKDGKVPKDDPHREFIWKAAIALRSYAEGKATRVIIHEATLNGLAGAVLGCACQEGKGGQGIGFLPAQGYRTMEYPGGSGYVIPPPKGLPEAFASDRLPANHGDTLRFQGRWRDLFGQPVRGFSALVYGQPKSGKSTLAADLGGYLARNHGRVLYASIEEGARGTVTERIARLGAAHPDMVVANYLPADLGPYRFVITDSVSRGKLDLEQMRALIRNWPEVSFVFIFHVTKDGLPRGSAEFQHEVDVIVEVKDGLATALGRFGPGQTNVRFS